MPVKSEDIRKAFEAFESDWLSDMRSGVIVLSVIEEGKEWLWNYKKKKVDIPFPKVKRKVVEARGPFRVSVVDPDKLEQALPPPKRTRSAASIAAGGGDGGRANDYVAMRVKSTKEDIWTDGAPTHLGD